MTDRSEADRAGTDRPGTGIPLDGAGAGFDAVAADLDPRRSYSVRVPADPTGDGRITPGDFVSVQSYPVDAEGGAPLAVEVQAIGG